jgi:flagellar hook protein FlgE
MNSADSYGEPKEVIKMSSIFTGVSGILSNQKAIDVIANNVANLNTVGFKTGRANFEETLVQTLAAGSSQGTNPAQVGMGVNIGSIETVMTQGNLQQTNRTLDLAAVGDGFFVVSEGNREHFTRDGVFQLDAQNRLVMGSNGMSVVGWQADAFTGHLDISTSPSTDFKIPIGTLYAVPTTNAIYGGNLSSGSAVGGKASSTCTVYDSLGAQHTVNVEFTKTGDNAWTWAATSPDGTLATVGSNVMSFDAHGKAITTQGEVNLTLTPPNGATTPQRLMFDLSAISQLNGDNSLQTTSQDGLPMGVLDTFNIESDGRVIGSFSNGASRVIGQIAMANFTNPSGLSREGNNLWSKSPNSGEPVIQASSVGGTKIRSGFIEQSNVDLATEFANLIVSQRAYQANTRSITTADEMMQDILQLKR